MNIEKKETSSKKWLNEVSFMRPILLVLLVSYHAFAPWVGSWPLMEGVHEVESYRWIGLLSRAFRLEGFVFISGYIFTFQIEEKHKFNSLGSLIKSKLERLILPSIFFSALYIYLFLDYKSVWHLLLRSVNGEAHLWYLPCLFWCFIIQYVILKRGIHSKLLLPFFVVGIFVSFIHLPMHLNKALYYICFFYGGGMFWKFSHVIAKYSSIKSCIISWIIFASCFFLATVAIEIIKDNGRIVNNLFVQGCSMGLNNIIKAILGWSGIYALYISSVLWCKNNKINDTVIKIGTCGYGVYVFHQFILVYLYRYTSLPVEIGTYALPWFGFVVTTIISICLTLLVRQTKIGRRYL